jgi:hypothetical protein
LNTEHICIKAEPEDSALLKQKGFHVLCERYRQFDESKKDWLCVFNTNSQKPVPANLNVPLEDSTLLDTVQAKYNLLSKREAFHVICNADRFFPETAETAEISKIPNRQIKPSQEWIRSTPEEAKQTSKRIAALKEALDLKAEADHKHTLEVQKRALATARLTPQSLKVTDWGAGHIGIDTGVKIQSKDLREIWKDTAVDVNNEHWLGGGDHYPIPDANGFYGNFDWTPEQIAQMEKSIPCKGYEGKWGDWNEDEQSERIPLKGVTNWEPPTWWHDIFK